MSIYRIYGGVLPSVMPRGEYEYITTQSTFEQAVISLPGCNAHVAKVKEVFSRQAPNIRCFSLDFKVNGAPPVPSLVMGYYIDKNYPQDSVLTIAEPLAKIDQHDSQTKAAIQRVSEYWDEIKGRSLFGIKAKKGMLVLNFQEKSRYCYRQAIDRFIEDVVVLVPQLMEKVKEEGLTPII